MSAIEAATFWNKVIPCNFFKSLIKLDFSCFLFYVFPFYINKFIKGKIFVYVKENICSSLSQLQPETGESIDFFQINNQIIIFMFDIL